MKLSIVIASCNRPLHLAKLRLSLVSQKTRDVEIIIIKNSFGLAKARNIGWKKARGKYVAYIDDDAVASYDWVENILKFIVLYPEVVAFGGPYHSSNQASIPTWIPMEVISKKYPGKIERPIDVGVEWLNGTNMIFSRKVLKEIGGFDERLGIHGSTRAYGEETDFQIRLHNAGYDIWYSPSIMVLHEFAQFKQNFIYLIKNQYIHGKNSYAVFKNLIRSDPLQIASSLIVKLGQKKLPLKSRLYYVLSPFAYLLGKFVGRFNSSHS